MIADYADKGTKQRLINLIVGEDDPDIRNLLATLLAFGEVEVDGEAPYRVGTDTMRLLDETEMFESEEIGTNIRRYWF